MLAGIYLIFESNKVNIFEVFNMIFNIFCAWHIRLSRFYTPYNYTTLPKVTGQACERYANNGLVNILFLVLKIILFT